jgi:transcriptional regulator of acetoin/glycerol metabolism
VNHNESIIAVSQQNIAEAWRRFAEGQSIEGFSVPEHVLKGWKLSRKFGVDATHPVAPPVLGPKEFATLRNKYAALLESAEPMLHMLEVSIRDTGYIAILAVASGHLLAVVGDCDQLGLAYTQYNVPGAVRSIRNVGASALSLCISERRPIMVTGHEHYNRFFHDWRCAAAPIFDGDGEAIASLTISSHISRRDTHTLTLVQSCAHCIGTLLREKALMASQRRLNAMLQSVHNALPEAVVAVNAEGAITHANNKAVALFGRNRCTEHADIRSLFGKPDLPRVQALLEAGKAETMELEVLCGKGPNNHICRFAPVLLDGGEPCGMTVSISTKGQMIDIAKRVGGNYAKYYFNDIKGESAGLREQIALAKRAAASAQRILLTGESGTGKELFAQSIHNSSPTSQGPFVAISCAAIPRDLIESELFGYVGGAFTGARRNGMIGKMELATGGTLFLDEINSLPLEMQGKLLRVLQQMEIVRIGDTKPTPINARVIAATNRNLREAVNQGTFREDLYFRLNVVEITIPPLRRRLDDIALLAHTFLRRQSFETNIPFSHITADAMDALYSYAWPGNVRELDNACERALLLAGGGVIRREHLPAHIAAGGGETAPSAPTARGVRETYKDLVAATLETHNGNISKAAAHLGVARSTLYRKMREFGLEG